LDSCLRYYHYISVAISLHVTPDSSPTPAKGRVEGAHNWAQIAASRGLKKGSQKGSKEPSECGPRRPFLPALSQQPSKFSGRNLEKVRVCCDKLGFRGRVGVKKVNALWG